MSIIVHKNEPVDEALKRLHAESIRENIFDTFNKKRYQIKESRKKYEKKKEWMKRKKRHRSAKRKQKRS
ncbi:MAG: 30S ribosomal protein S21 [Candidatus Dojkabacteria bacterium]|nr:30S ribosomal protein S21 [Candidatus Dojkabacteria bacterium]